MKNLLPLRNVIKSVFCCLTFFMMLLQVNVTFAQVNQEDAPNLDRPPLQIRLHPPQNLDVPMATVITVDNWDNWNLGTDFAENNIATSLQNPTWNFCAYNTNAGHHTEDGSTWTNVVPNFGTGLAGDPVVAYDSLGNLFYINLYPASSIAGVKVIKSSDNGASWGTAVTGAAGNDKCWIAADQTAGPYANNVYVCMTNNSVGSFARSTDHGATFTTTFSPNTQNLPGMSVCVGPNGSIQGGSVYTVTNSGSSFASTYTFYRSTDGGATFTKMSNQSFSGYVGTYVQSRNSVQGMRTRPYPYIAADNSYGSHRGRLYNVYASNDPPGDGNKPDIWCRYSDDFGVTWSNAIRVNDDANTQSHHQWHPAIWCEKQTGRLYVNFMDTRDTPTNDSAYIYSTYSDDGGTTWAANQRISNKKMKIDCGSCGGGGTPRYQGDYNGVVSNKKVSMSAWTDFRNNTFMSVAAYFPDFAMALDHNADTLFSPIDSTTFQVSIPGVKLYTDTVVLSATISPTPTSGTLVFHFPQGNKITSFPGTKPVNIVLTGSVPNNLYQAVFKAAGPNGTPVHTRTATIRVMTGSAFLAMASATPSNICLGQTSQLNVSLIGGTAPFTYSWSPQAGLSNPNIANPVATPTATTRYHVTVSDNASHVSNDSVLITVGTAPATPGPISGNDLVCLGSTTNYLISELPGASSYSWTVPAGDTITLGQNTNSISVNWRSATSGNISVIAGNDCGNSTPSVYTVAVQQGLSNLGSISGQVKNCKNTAATYSVVPVANAESYIWTVPQGVTITNGQNSDTIRVVWGIKPGDISVVAKNHCDTTPSVSLSVHVDSIPEAAGTITGKDSLCLGHNGYVFSVQEIPGALSYEWTLPNGFTINGAQTGSQITVDVNSSAVSGSVYVKGINDCGSGTENAKNTIVGTCGWLQENLLDGNVTVYPNPARQLLNIAFKNKLKEVSLTLTDVNGREIFRESLENIQTGFIKEINVSKYSKGIYFLQVKCNNSLYTEKVIVQ